MSVTFEPQSFNLMNRPPRAPSQPLLSSPRRHRIALISIFNMTQFRASISARLQGMKVPLRNGSAIGYGIGVAVVLQAIFSQAGVMNALFQTAAFTLEQGLIGLGVSLPMIGVARVANRLNPQN